jgi:tRNA(adenine34) deaminase
MAKTAIKLRTRASVLCVEEGKLLVVRLRDPGTGKIFRMPPGGKIEKGERPEHAALRELREETGYEARIDPQSESILHYPFVWSGEVHACRTYFFKGCTRGLPKPVSAKEACLEGCEWVEISVLLQEWNFHPQLRDALSALLTVASVEKPKRIRKKA